MNVETASETNKALENFIIRRIDHQIDSSLSCGLMRIKRSYNFNFRSLKIKVNANIIVPNNIQKESFEFTTHEGGNVLKTINLPVKVSITGQAVETKLKKPEINFVYYKQFKTIEKQPLKKLKVVRTESYGKFEFFCQWVYNNGKWDGNLNKFIVKDFKLAFPTTEPLYRFFGSKALQLIHTPESYQTFVDASINPDDVSFISIEQLNREQTIYLKNDILKNRLDSKVMDAIKTELESLSIVKDRQISVSKRTKKRLGLSVQLTCSLTTKNNEIRIFSITPGEDLTHEFIKIQKFILTSYKILLRLVSDHIETGIKRLLREKLLVQFKKQFPDFVLNSK